MQLSTEGILGYGFTVAKTTLDERNILVFLYYQLPAFLEVVFSLILVVSAYYITRWVKQSSGKRYNICLLTWHVLNLFTYTIVITLVAICYKRIN